MTNSGPADTDPETQRRMPYQKPQPAEILPDLVVANAIPLDERVWVPQADQVWFRPLCLNRSAGYWMNLLRVRRAGVLSRHRHPGPVHALVLKGSWRYLEHDLTHPALGPVKAWFDANIPAEKRGDPMAIAAR